MKTFLKVILSIIIIFVLVVAGGIFYISRGLDSGSKIEVNTVNLDTLDDGIYSGKYAAGRWTNKVAVTVKDHKITKIDVTEDVTFPKPEWTEQLINRILEKQNTDVDAISGATVTSKAYLKAIEDALKSK